MHCLQKRSALWLRPSRKSSSWKRCGTSGTLMPGWVQWVHLHNAFVTRKGIEASHAFTFKVRADLSTAEVHNIPRKRKRFDEHQEDVFAIAKGRMRMTKTQPPVLAIPHCLLALMHGKEPKNMKAARDMPNDRKKGVGQAGRPP